MNYRERGNSNPGQLGYEAQALSTVLCHPLVDNHGCCSQTVKYILCVAVTHGSSILGIKETMQQCKSTLGFLQLQEAPGIGVD